MLFTQVGFKIGGITHRYLILTPLVFKFGQVISGAAAIAKAILVNRKF